MIIYQNDGGKVEYRPPRPRQAVPIAGLLTIDNENPVCHLQWWMSRGQLIRLSLRCIWAALQRS
jgi:hypothetical protein